MIPGENIIRKVIPDFDLYNLGEVRSLSLAFRKQEADGRPITDLLLNVSYPLDYQSYLLTLKLSDVHQLRLPEIGPYGFQLSELEIHPISERMMEGLNFHVEDFGYDGMSCDCREVRFVRVSELSWSESESTLWTADATADVHQVVMGESVLWASDEVDKPQIDTMNNLGSIAIRAM